MDAIFLIVAIVMSVVLHEVAHGWAANALGDPTARLQGRLTLNPIKHLDPLGSVLIPALLVFSGSSFLFGWAKPVPYNPYNFKRGGKWAEALVAGAGPAVNFALAIFFALVIRMFGGYIPGIVELGFFVVAINIMLGIFNLIPIPPLDGSKVLGVFLPQSLALGYMRFRSMLEMNPFLGFGVVILFIVLFGREVAVFISNIAQMLVGA